MPHFTIQFPSPEAEEGYRACLKHLENIIDNNNSLLLNAFPPNRATNIRLNQNQYILNAIRAMLPPEDGAASEG